MNRILNLFLIFILFASVNAYGQADKIVGKWTTVDDETGKAKSIVKIFKATNGKFYGKIEQLLNRKTGDENPNLKHPNAYDGKYKTADGKVIGLMFIRDLVYDADDNEWEDGTIFDPEKGKEYTCSIKIKDGKLNVRGSLDPWGIAGRTQIWNPDSK